MPTIYFADNTSKQVEYSVAAKIREILSGEREPENEEQAAYVSHVIDVTFESLPGLKPIARIETHEHDTEMDKILTNPNLHGRAKFRAVAERLRKRTR